MLVRIGQRLGGEQTPAIVDTFADQAAAGNSLCVMNNDDGPGRGRSRRIAAPKLPSVSRSVLTTPAPAQLIVRSDLLPLPGAARHSRNLLTEACLRWDIGHRLADACVVASELVGDSRRRFPGPSTLTAVHHQDLLYIAVRRGVSGPTAEQDETLGLGFLLIHAVTTCWGVFRHEVDVITWAAVPSRAGLPSPAPLPRNHLPEYVAPQHS
jgi:hypothetical protein